VSLAVLDGSANRRTTTVVLLLLACFLGRHIDFTYVLPTYFDFVHGVAALYRTCVCQCSVSLA